MAYGTVNADVVQSSVSGVSLGAGNASIMKNRLINGAMVISQSANGGSVSSSNTTNVFPVDRFQMGATQNSKCTLQQNAGSVTPPAGFKNYVGITSSSAYSLASADYFWFGQTIEGYNIADLGWGTANAKTVTLSFWAYSSLTGTFGGSVTNGGYTRSYPFTYSIPVANTWTQISVTIAGDTSGTWATDNTAGTRVFWSFGAGTTFSGTAGAWAGATYLSATGVVSPVSTNGATLYITGAQFEVGSSATGFEYRMIGQELSLCQRYYEVLTNYSDTYCALSSLLTGSVNWFQWVFKQTKRATPTITQISGNSWVGVVPTYYPAIDSAGFQSTSQYFYNSGTAGATGISASAEL